MVLSGHPDENNATFPAAVPEVVRRTAVSPELEHTKTTLPESVKHTSPETMNSVTLNRESPARIKSSSDNSIADLKNGLEAPKWFIYVESETLHKDCHFVAPLDDLMVEPLPVPLNGFSSH